MMKGRGNTLQQKRRPHQNNKKSDWGKFCWQKTRKSERIIDCILKAGHMRERENKTQFLN